LQNGLSANVSEVLLTNPKMLAKGVGGLESINSCRSEYHIGRSAPLTAGAILADMGERLGFNGNSIINNSHPIERKPIIIAFDRVDVEGQLMRGRLRRVNSIVTIRSAPHANHAHGAMSESRRFVISFFSMRGWTRPRTQRLKEGWTKERRKEEWK
jgi:hypothetical protein